MPLLFVRLAGANKYHIVGVVVVKDHLNTEINMIVVASAAVFIRAYFLVPYNKN